VSFSNFQSFLFVFFFSFFFFLLLLLSSFQMADAVMSALGDVFDDMTLQILHRKKEKAGAPEKLVASVGLVAQCTSKLEQIALALAKDEYADFPVVAAEINDAAKSVRDGAADMAKAVAALQKGGDTVSAWDDVGSAVGLMVQKVSSFCDARPVF
jgi:hypothetical protein